MPLKTYTALLNQSGSGNIIPITSSGDYGVTYYRTNTGSYYFSVASGSSVNIQLNSFILIILLIQISKFIKFQDHYQSQYIIYLHMIL
jgi:hypothetical protein